MFERTRAARKGKDRQPGEAVDAPGPAPSVAGAVAQFVLAGLVVVVVVGVVGLFVLRALGHREAIRNARQLAALAGQGIIEPTLNRRVLAGDPQALARLDRVVQERILDEGVVRVKIWSSDGRIVYSDEQQLIGSRYGLGRTSWRRSAPARPRRS